MTRFTVRVGIKHPNKTNNHKHEPIHISSLPHQPLRVQRSNWIWRHACVSFEYLMMRVTSDNCYKFMGGQVMPGTRSFSYSSDLSTLTDNNARKLVAYNHNHHHSFSTLDRSSVATLFYTENFNKQICSID